MFKKLVVTLLLLPFLTSCATYNSGFGCGDAKGVPCTPMERVDLLISNGEIEHYVSGKKRCRGRACRKQQQDDVLVKALLQDKKTGNGK